MTEPQPITPCYEAQFFLMYVQMCKLLKEMNEIVEKDGDSQKKQFQGAISSSFITASGMYLGYDINEPQSVYYR